MPPQAAIAALLAMALAAPTHAQTHPAAQCAAFWLGRDDVARRSAHLARNPEDLALAEAFRAATLATTPPGPLAAFLATERANMALLTEAAILGDPQSLRLHDRLAADCGAPP